MKQKLSFNTHIPLSHVHFVGIGGIGMCGLAELFFNLGAEVSGSDISENANVERLRALGVSIFIGHDKKNISKAKVLVRSSAVNNSNVEVAEARQNKIPVIPRAEALAELMRLKRGIAVAGTHGKTTTTSLVSSIFIGANLKPTIVNGGRLELIDSTACLGEGPWFIAEADESDGSFLKLTPEISVITNIDNDHLDNYKTFDNIKKAFYTFADKIPYYGSVIIFGDQPESQELFKDYNKEIIFYGTKEHNNYVLKKINSKYLISFKNRIVGEFTPPMPGLHNALNCLAAIIVGIKAGVDMTTCIREVERFKGVGRRFELVCEINNILIYDDYAHHPTEIRAVIQAFKEKFPNKKLIALFEPHRFSRTKDCWREYATCFKGIDTLLLKNIYPAGEAPIPGITSKDLLANLDFSGEKHLVTHPPEECEFLLGHIKSGDIFVTLGAGKVWQYSKNILAKINDPG